LNVLFGAVKFRRPDNPEYYTRWRDILGSLRYALVALAVAAGCFAAGISGRVWAFIPAAIAAIFAVADALLAWQGSRTARASELQDLLAGKVCRAGEARATEYGVDLAVLPEGQKWRYVRRDFECELRAALKAALARTGPSLVMLSGDTKSGKTRTAFECLAWAELKDALLVVPRDGASVERLLRLGVLPRSWTPLVVWLDDIERYVSVDASGLHEGTLRNLECDRPVVLLATEGGRGSRSRSEALIDPVEQLRGLAATVDVQVKLSAPELARAGEVYDGRLLQEIENVGIGRRMVAMSELKSRLIRSPDSSREGVAVIRAAVDWRRAGASRPLSVAQLELLYRFYLPDDLDPCMELFERGLQWTREPLPRSQIALLRRTLDDNGYEPYDLVVEMAAEQWPRVNGQALKQIVSIAEPPDCFQIATVAYDDGNSPLALELLARAEDTDDLRLSAMSAFNTGVVLAEARDLAGAEDAFRRADRRGSLRGAFNLGQLLRRAGDLVAAEAAYRRADERGSPEGAVNLGILLEGRQDLAGAEAAYRRASERGSRKGAHNLQSLLGL
jgi:tetratricopeptide (TPR) repeat protein